MTNEVKFFDNRQRYLLFVTTTNEKAVISEKLSHLINEIAPAKPALRIFDAGVGDGAVLMNVLRICPPMSSTGFIKWVQKKLKELPKSPLRMIKGTSHRFQQKKV